MEDLTLTNILHVVGQGIKIPCIVVLLLLLIATVWQIGDVLVEFIIERRKVKEDVPALLKKLNGMKPEEMKKTISDSKILKSQKKMLIELIEAGDMPKNSQTALAQKLLDDESSFFEKGNVVSDMVAKIGPMFGLLGTLIPLGPGIVALGQGDTATLSDSLGVAFDTTIAGLIAAALCFVISGIRRRWYDDYMSTSEAIAEIILEGEADK